MGDLSRDFVTNFVHGQLKRSIRVLLEAECLSAAVVLIYSGMDTMAWIGMPAGQRGVTRTDFIRWAGRYVRFPCREQLTGEDLYGARCAMVHQYGAESAISRQGKCRLVGYMNDSIPEIRFQPAVDPDLVLVSVKGLAEAFFRSVDTFLIDVFADKNKASVAETRIEKIVHEFSVGEGTEDVK